MSNDSLTLYFKEKCQPPSLAFQNQIQIKLLELCCYTTYCKTVLLNNIALISVISAKHLLVFNCLQSLKHAILLCFAKISLVFNVLLQTKDITLIFIFLSLICWSTSLTRNYSNCHLQLLASRNQEVFTFYSLSLIWWTTSLARH